MKQEREIIGFELGFDLLIRKWRGSWSGGAMAVGGSDNIIIRSGAPPVWGYRRNRVMFRNLIIQDPNIPESWFDDKEAHVGSRDMP